MLTPWVGWKRLIGQLRELLWHKSGNFINYPWHRDRIGQVNCHTDFKFLGYSQIICYIAAVLRLSPEHDQSCRDIFLWLEVKVWSVYSVGVKLSTVKSVEICLLNVLGEFWDPYHHHQKSQQPLQQVVESWQPCACPKQIVSVLTSLWSMWKTWK